MFEMETPRNPRQAQVSEAVGEHLKHPQVGNSVANDLVHGGADGLGEVVVVEGRGVGFSQDSRLVHLLAGRPGLT